MKNIIYFLLCLTHATANAQADSLTADIISYIRNTSVSARDVHTDCEGSSVYVGGTASTGFTLTPGTITTSFQGGTSDAFIVKIDSSGQPMWSTLLGGNLYDRAYAVEIDSAGFIYLAGRAGPGLPTTACALQQIFSGDNNPNPEYGIQDGFIAKLTPDGSTIVWCTYVGCDGRGFIRDIDIDSDGNIWAGVSNAAPDFPYITSNAVQTTAVATMNPALIKLSSDGSTLLYGTFLSDGQATSAGPTTVRVDKNNNVYFLCHASANTIPVTPNAFQPTVAGNIDFVIAKFDTSGNLLFCSYLGGPGKEEVETHSLEIDTSGNVIVAAYTFGAGYPIVGNAFQSTFGGVREGVITKIAADGSAIIASTYLGGSLLDEIEGIGVDKFNNIYVSGTTASSDFPVTMATAFQPSLAGGTDGYFAVVSGDLSTVLYATFIGGTGNDKLRSSHVDEWGKYHGCGGTTSSDLPVVNPFNSSLTGSLTGCAVVFMPHDLLQPTGSCLIADSFNTTCLTTGAKEKTDFPTFNLYPNPSTGKTSISFSGIQKNSVLVFNSQGILIKQITAISPFQLDLSELPKGVYYIQLQENPGKVIPFIKL